MRTCKKPPELTPAPSLSWLVLSWESSKDKPFFKIALVAEAGVRTYDFAPLDFGCLASDFACLC